MAEKKTYMLTIAYDGTNFKGWHTQSDVPTIQGTLNSILSELYNEKIFTWGAGRTDAGAHAVKYTAHFRTKNDCLPLYKITSILNSKLPPEIRVYNIQEKPHEFHATFSCTARTYMYLIYQDLILPPFFAHKMHHDISPLDVEKLQQISKLFIGQKDFKNFCYGYSQEEKKYKTTIRRLDYFSIRKKDNILLFFIQGEGFLRGMIRSLIGIGLAAARGNLHPSDIEHAFQNTPLDNTLWKPVPAHGLYFKRAHYPWD